MNAIKDGNGLVQFRLRWFNLYSKMHITFFSKGLKQQFSPKIDSHSRYLLV